MTGSGGLLAAGLTALAVGAATDLVFGARPTGQSRTPGDQGGRDWTRADAPISWLRALPYLAGVAGSACLAAVGALAVAGRAARLGPAGWLGTGTSGLAADRLSGLFLLIAFSAAALVSVAFADCGICQPV